MSTFDIVIACWVLILGAPAAWWVYRVLTGPKPSAAVVARAEQIAATPAHPSVRGWSQISDEERRQLAVITCMYQAGAEAPEPEYRTRGESS